MDRGKFARFLEEEEALRKDPEYQALLQEFARSGETLCRQLVTMNQAQADAVTDYCGLLIELNWAVLMHFL